jgi:hypothetical protein
MVEDIRGRHQLVGAGLSDEIIEPAPDRFPPADDRASIRVVQYRARLRIQPRLEILEWRRHTARSPEPVVQSRLLQ